MRKTLAAAVAILVTGGATAAGAATGDTPAQRFKIEIVNQTSRALASGAVVNGQGTAAQTGPASFELRFPGAGPANLTVSPATVVRSISAGCLERLSESGTFSFFGFNPGPPSRSAGTGRASRPASPSTAGFRTAAVRRRRPRSPTT
jgi:hypothetical protein